MYSQQTILIISFYLGALLVLLVLCTISGSLKKDLIATFKVSLLFFIGVTLTTSLLRNDWEVAVLFKETQVQPGCGQTVNGTLEVQIGLQGFAITLTASAPLEGCLKDQIINSRRDFYWSTKSDQTVSKQLTHARLAGVPKPIVWTAEPVEESEFVYQIAAGFCRICLHAALVCYVTALVLLNANIRASTYSFGLCGLLQLTTAFLWFSITRTVEHYEIICHFGTSFWLVIFNGVLCLTTSLVLFVIDLKFQNYLYGRLERQRPAGAGSTTFLDGAQESRKTESIPMVPPSHSSRDSEIYYAICNESR